ncbi:MAG: hypothetical protein LBN93_11605 [Candidatus Symbiothrix sp.]|jgi:hypothetical protein|nr:hypothetical protein [Candidatus Symbiothrix sp.]
MKERIKIIMDNGGYTPVTFAAHIGINPQTMTANLNRNENVSTPILQAILKKYENISAEWLMLGEGQMYKTKEQDPRQLPLFPNQEQPYPSQRPQMSEQRKETPDKSPEKVPETIKYQEVIVEKIVAKKITKIIIYYADNTFDTFAPELS